MFCPSCGTQNADGSSFCTKCGAAIGVIVEKPIAKPAAPPVQQAPAVPEVPAVQPAQPRPASYSTSYRASYSTGGASPMAWVILVAAVVGIGGLFLPMISSGGQTIFDGVRDSFSDDHGSKWLLIHPAAYVLSALIALFIGVGAVTKKAGWLGLVTLFSGMLLGINLVQWLSLGPDMGQLGVGFWMQLAASAVMSLLAAIMLFGEG